LVVKSISGMLPVWAVRLLGNEEQESQDGGKQRSAHGPTVTDDAARASTALPESLSDGAISVARRQKPYFARTAPSGRRKQRQAARPRGRRSERRARGGAIDEGESASSPRSERIT
jgi:hypothetical protein